MTRHGPAVLEAAHHVLDRLPELLEHLAAERHAGNAAPALDIIVTHPAAQTPGSFPPSKWHEFLHTSLRHSGLLTVRSGELAFLHETLLEYLAARHVTRTPESRAHLIRQAFHHPRRYQPGLDFVMGIRPRLWGWRCWDPPPHEAESYIGFLIDTARDRDRAAGTRQLARLASTRAGIPGCEFICTQIQLGTRVPESTIRAAADLLCRSALKRRFFGADARGYYWHSQAARALADLGDPRAADVWYARATDRDFGGYHGHLEAARALADLGDPRAADVWYARAISDPLWFALDLDLSHHSERSLGESGIDGVYMAARALTNLGDPRAADVWCALALSDRHNPFGSSSLEAAEALADLGDPRAADVWYALATDHDFQPPGRVQAAKGLARLGDPRAARLSRTLAADLRYTLADDRQSYWHMKAAEALAELERFFFLDDAEQSLIARRQ
jgi:HEAT repeat protein